ncbi:MAG: GDP-mannose 4,6-dehydratase [Thermoleophilaceae bacterium]|nr:GDP-mannose 4,6-dehydratase [Thermoleophilaceae bacterium]
MERTIAHIADATENHAADAAPRRALITGIGGQDGSYLTEILLARGYTVSGVVERDPAIRRSNLTAVQDQIDLHTIDLTDRDAVDALVSGCAPHEIYNLAAPSFVPASWDDPTATLDFMSGSTVRLLDAIVRLTPETRYFQASSSEIFRGTDQSPQNEETTPRPISPYGVGKLAGHGLVNSFRVEHGVFACSGILFNHESPRRPVDFVTRKIVNGAARIKRGELDKLQLGDLSAKRDWGYAPDYVEAMWKMLQVEEPDDYVLATGKLHTVEQLVEAAFAEFDLDPKEYVVTDPNFLRKADEALLVGDPTRAAEKLGWSATTSFEEMIAIMAAAELAGD